MKTFSKSLRFMGLIICCVSGVALGEDAVALSPTLSFGKFPVAVSRTTVLAHPGLPAGKAELDSPFPDDFPPHIVATLEDGREYPALKKGARYFQPAGIASPPIASRMRRRRLTRPFKRKSRR